MFWNNSIIEEYGGALYVDSLNTEIEVTGCHFTGNRAASGGGIYLGVGNEIYICESLFHQNNITKDGGGLFLDDDNFASINFTNFTEHSCQRGAAIHTISYNILHLRDVFVAYNKVISGAAISLGNFHRFLIFYRVHFFSNIVEDFGSAGLDIGDASYYITLEDCTFENNRGWYTGAGFSIAQYSGSIQFNSCVFLHNFAYYGGSGFISYQNSEIEFQSCLFRGGISRNGGAVMLYLVNIDISFKDCIFESNRAQYGGAVYVYSDGYNIGFDQTNFLNNTAREEGGAIYVGGNSVIDISNSKLLSNSVLLNGGAVSLSHMNSFYFVNTVFTKNSALNGGAIFVSSENYLISIRNNTFYSNYASTNGGSIAIKDSNRDIQIFDSLFDSNAAGRAGGGISLQSDNPEFYLSDCIFIMNKATSTGGGIYSALANFNLQINKTYFEQNSARYGGGVYIGDYHSPVFIGQSTFLLNYAEYGSGLYLSPFSADVLILETNFHNNIAAGGAAGLMSYASPIILDSCNFDYNSAFSASSGYLHADAITVIGVKVSNGYGTGDTGGILLEDALDVVIQSSLFQNNTGVFGGAMLITSSFSAELENCSFRGNVGFESAGAIWIESTSHVIIHNNSFSSNEARRGGALYLHSLKYFTLCHSSFVDNVAQVDAGAIISTSGVSVINNTVFFQNIANDGFGSAVYLSSSETWLNDNQFLNNFALNGAGTVFWEYWSAMNEPFGLRHSPSRNVFENNEAMYGKDFATEAVELFLLQSNQYEVLDYEVSLPPIGISLRDAYHQQIQTESSSVLELNSLQEFSCHGHYGYISGGVISQFQNGVANFTSLEAYCAPGYTMAVETQYFSENILPINFSLSFRTCNIGEYYSGYICKLCESGTYSVTYYDNLDEMSQIEVCKKCPSQAQTCIGSSLDLKSGYWRASTGTDVIFPCPTGDNGCKGGFDSGDDLCHEGYHGPLCSLCDDGYGMRQTTNTCVQCRETNGFDEIAIIFFLMIGLLLILLLLYRFHPLVKQIKSFDDFILLVVSKFGSKTASDPKLIHSAKILSKRIFARIKVYVTLYQILSVLPFVLAMVFPNPLTFFIYCWKFLSGTMSDSTLPECNRHSYDFVVSLVVDTIFPLAISSLLFAARTVHILYLKWKETKSVADDVISLTKDRYFMIFILWTYLILPSVSTKIFQTFSCKDLDPEDDEPGDQLYMTADYSVSCTSPRYYFAFFWAIGMIFVYPLGCPALYFYLLYTNRIGISTRNPATSFLSVADMTPEEKKIFPLRFLFHSYHPHLWWWEMIETANRLLLTGILVLIEQGSALQIVIGIILSLLFIHLYDHFNPFDDHIVASVKNISQWQIFFVFFIALLFKANFSSIDSVSLTAAFIVVIFFNFLFDLMKFLYSFYDHNLDQNSSSKSHCVHNNCSADDPQQQQQEEEMRRSLARGVLKSKQRENSHSSEALSLKDMEMTSSPLNHDEKVITTLSLEETEDADQV